MLAMSRRVGAALLLALVCVVFGQAASWASQVTPPYNGWSFNGNGGTYLDSASTSTVARVWRPTMAAQAGMSAAVIVYCDSTRMGSAQGTGFQGGVNTVLAGALMDMSYATNGCSAGQTISADIGYTTGACCTVPAGPLTSVSYQVQVRLGGAVVVLPACTSTTVAGSWNGTTLAVRVSGATSPPGGGWRVDAPDPGNILPVTPTTTIRLTDNVDGSSGTYYRSVALATLVNMTVRVTQLDASGVPVCYKSVALSSNPIGTTAGSSSGPAEGDGAAENGCGFSINPIVWMKCLWQPTTATTGPTGSWATFRGNVEGRPPFSIVVGVTDFVSCLGSEDMDCGGGGGSASWVTGDTRTDANLCTMGSDGDDPTQCVDLLAGDTVGSGAWPDIFTAGMWISTAFALWAMVSRTFGRTGSSSDAD